MVDGQYQIVTNNSLVSLFRSVYPRTKMVSEVRVDGVHHQMGAGPCSDRKQNMRPYEAIRCLSCREEDSSSF